MAARQQDDRSAVRRLPRLRPLRAGIAMMLVLGVVVLATVLGLAMISAATLQSFSAQNASAMVSADALAESGIDLACYYLIRPDKAPAFTGNYWPGKTGIGFGSNVNGTVDVTVRLLSQDSKTSTYAVTSTGKAAGLQRVEKATVQVATGLVVTSGAGFSGGITLPTLSQINGDIQVKGTLINLGSVTGSIMAQAFSGLFTQYSAANATAIPSTANVNTYGTYTYKGQTYSAKQIAGVQTGTTYGPTADNPAGVFYSSSGIEFHGNVAINGTLVLNSGNLKITGANNQITPMDGYPAAVIKGGIEMQHSKLWAPGLALNGLVWTNNNIKSTTSGSAPYQQGNLTVNGAWLSAGGSIDATFLSRIVINQDKSKVGGLSLDTSALPPQVFYKAFK